MKYSTIAWVNFYVGLLFFFAHLFNEKLLGVAIFFIVLGCFGMLASIKDKEE